ncbi:hypothetical protein GIB67_040718 [Kingdonia uniflora]|uniref:MINDY deubiquitinase domain-containing protein n=1 Tax=Kingdonia uniflora TaxID=39325 RepID=A0A7J7KUG3_9MAGN|nr:hypothetical protein GIB67_040718 [Kingdonia uniflora]
MATDDLPNDNEIEKETLYKTKAIHFLGRQTPIILQNDNGPCPLLAICNVLLLKNNLNLHPEVSEVSVQKLLSLVAEKLIDCNCCNEDKDAGYVENQQQNISDAIDLLPSLATGIDVNVQFQRIDGFEFTRECAIFDLLGIPLYHGWIVDPQEEGEPFLRDSSGQVLGSLMQGLAVVPNFLVEYSAIVSGLTLTAEMGWKVAWLKSDPVAIVLSFK